VRDGQRLILVLNGLRYPDLDKMTPAAQDWHGVQRRGDEAARIMGLAFREFRRYQLFKPNDIVGQAPVWQGEDKTVPLTVASAVAPTMQVDSRPGLKVSLHYNAPIHAPIDQGQKLGTLTVTAPDYPGLTVPVYAAKAVPEEGIFGRMIVGVESLFSGKK
jgi:D-alanyl-D-alanine carboxypeptidase (penicillin-binding protein 5/6)